MENMSGKKYQQLVDKALIHLTKEKVSPEPTKLLPEDRAPPQAQMVEFSDRLCRAQCEEWGGKLFIGRGSLEKGYLCFLCSLN